jgi:four helix bundle protein
MGFAFEKLAVYQRSVDLADGVCQLTENFARGYGFLTDQLNRAALSISASIAEGNGRFTLSDRRNFGIARGDFANARAVNQWLGASRGLNMLSASSRENRE